jgi:hypothetical protein
MADYAPLIRRELTPTSPVAPVASGKSDFVVVTGEALSIAAVVGEGNQSLFPGLK